MHKRELIHKVIDEEVDYQKDKLSDLDSKWDYTKQMLVVLMRARTKFGMETWNDSMEGLDSIREVVAVGTALLQKFGYTRRYKQP